MNRACAIFLAAGIMAFARPAPAQPAAVVEGVQMPAWVEREGRRSPLAVGMELKGGDSLKTGAGSRALVKLSEGSLVKLGENGTLQINEINPQRDGFFRAAMRVAEGEKPVTMDQARQFYRREKGQTQAVGFVTPEQIVEWSKETEIEAGKGAARRGGKWKVTLASAETQEAALALYDRVRANGFAAEIRPAKAGEKLVYHVRISNLPSKEEAEALAARLHGRHGVAEPRVSA